MNEQASVSPFSTEILLTIACEGVSWYLPPKGMTTVPAPMVESKRSDRPRLEQTFRSPARLSQACLKSSGTARS